jgi:hypothetical protein
MFAPESWVIADIESQEFNQPAKLFIDCVEKSEVIILDTTPTIKIRPKYWPANKQCQSFIKTCCCLTEKSNHVNECFSKRPL